MNRKYTDKHIRKLGKTPRYSQKETTSSFIIGWKHAILGVDAVGRRYTHKQYSGVSVHSHRLKAYEQCIVLFDICFLV